MQPHTVVNHGGLTAAQGTRWVLRNLFLLVSAFLPTVLILASTLNCIDLAPADRCGAAVLFVAPLVWLWFVIPVLVIGGVHVLLLLAVAWRSPRLARVLAVVTLVAMLPAWAGDSGPGGSPYDAPFVALGILYYAFMLRLHPGQRLKDAVWVWSVPAGLVGVHGALAIAGVV